MNKEEFLEILKKRLAYLSSTELKKHLDFYEEAINDRIDEGMNEFDAVSDLGSLTDIVALINSEYQNIEAKENKTEEVKETKQEEVKDDVKEDAKEDFNQTSNTNTFNQNNTYRSNNSNNGSNSLVPLVVFIVLSFFCCSTAFGLLTGGITTFGSAFLFTSNTTIMFVMFATAFGLLAAGIAVAAVSKFVVENAIKEYKKYKNGGNQ